MITYLIRRLLWALVLFVAVTLVTYLVFYVIPANPARLACGQRATEECIQKAEQRLGLDHPAPVQYALFLKRLVIEIRSATPLRTGATSTRRSSTRRR